VGDVVFNVGFFGTIVPVGMAERIAQKQVECIEAGGCAEPLTLDDIFSFDTEAEDDADEGSTPAAEAGNEDSESESGGNIYESDLHPFTLTYDDTV
jgi:hypothetical protein